MRQQTRRRGWALMVVLVVLSVIIALGGTLMSSLVRQRLQMRRNVEEQQARWLAASVARMAPIEARDASNARWQPSLPTDSPCTQLLARIEHDPSGQRRVVVESSENENRRIVYSEVLITPSSK